MIIINKPFTARIDDNNRYTTHLHFNNGAVKRFYMRGALAFPEGKKEGFALMAGMDLIENVVIVFDQFRYWTIDHWLDQDGTIHERENEPMQYHLGLTKFIADNLALYQCASYFYGGQHIDVFNRYGKELYNKSSRRLELIEVPYVAEVGPNLLLEKINTMKFRVGTDTWLSKSIVQFVNMQAVDVAYDNAALCLMSLLAGFEHQPWVNVND